MLAIKSAPDHYDLRQNVQLIRQPGSQGYF